MRRGLLVAGLGVAVLALLVGVMIFVSATKPDEKPHEGVVDKRDPEAAERQERRSPQEQAHLPRESSEEREHIKVPLGDAPTTIVVDNPHRRPRDEFFHPDTYKAMADALALREAECVQPLIAAQPDIKGRASFEFTAVVAQGTVTAKDVRVSLVRVEDQAFQECLQKAAEQLSVTAAPEQKEGEMATTLRLRVP